jgi:hypothetical protein
MALIAPTRKLQGSGTYHVGSEYLFWTLPVKGPYDSYGNIEYDELGDNDLAVLEIFLRATIPGMKDFEEYGRDILEKGDLTPERAWYHIIGHDIIFDPDRGGSNKYPHNAMQFKVWMCHEWAWKELRSLDIAFNEEHKLPTHIDNWVDNRIDYMDHFRHWIEGDQGFMHPRLRSVLQSEDGAISEHRGEITQQLFDTAMTVMNLFNIRKHIIPVSTVGEQHGLGDLVKWTRIVADKARDKEREIEEF